MYNMMRWLQPSCLDLETRSLRHRTIVQRHDSSIPEAMGLDISLAQD